MRKTENKAHFFNIRRIDSIVNIVEREHDKVMASVIRKELLAFNKSMQRLFQIFLSLNLPYKTVQSYIDELKICTVSTLDNKMKRAFIRSLKKSYEREKSL